MCYIRDSLFEYFENIEKKRNGDHQVDEKGYKHTKESLMDFESQIEPLISILKDMCNTSSSSFNEFMRNVILK